MRPVFPLGRFPPESGNLSPVALFSPSAELAAPVTSRLNQIELCFLMQ